MPELKLKFALLLSPLVLLLTACGSEETFQASGKLEMNGKPVYPATLMLKDEKGTILPINVTRDGSFRLMEVRKAKYVAAIQTPKLANVGGGSKPAVAPESESGEKRREATVPEKFKGVSNDIPTKYNSFDTSELSYDFSEGVPSDLKIDLSK